MSEDASEPADALARLVQAIDEGRSPLDSEDLRAVSGSRADLEAVARERLDALDASARFALLSHLNEAMGDHLGLEFTAILRAALRDDDAPVRAAAATALGLCETAAATDALLATAGSDEEDDSVRLEAVASLGEVALRYELGWAGSEQADEVVPALRRIAEDAREEAAVRAGAIAGVAAAGADWIAPLLDDAYESAEPELRLGALRGMGRSADEAWIPVLEGAFSAADEDEQMAAVAAAGEIGSEEAVPALVELLSDPETGLDLVRAVAAALGEIGGEEAVEQLGSLRTHPEPEVREAVREALENAEQLGGDGDFENLAADPFGRGGTLDGGVG